MVNPILEQIKNQNSQNGRNANQGSGPLPTSMDDPRMGQVKDYVAKHGGDPKTAFFMLCKEKGITNPANLINRMLGRR